MPAGGTPIRPVSAVSADVHVDDCDVEMEVVQQKTKENIPRHPRHLEDHITSAVEHTTSFQTPALCYQCARQTPAQPHRPRFLVIDQDVAFLGRLFASRERPPVTEEVTLMVSR